MIAVKGWAMEKWLCYGAMGVAGFLMLLFVLDLLTSIPFGGISLLGGRGTIFFAIIPGAFIFEMIRNGLTNLGANPYSYRLVGGAVIFAAMYADALKSGRLALKRGTNA